MRFLIIVTFIFHMFSLSLSLRVSRGTKSNDWHAAALMTKSRMAISISDLLSSNSYEKGILPIDELFQNYTGLGVIGSMDEIGGRSVDSKKTKTSMRSPIYHAGYDKKDRPVWVFDFGALAVEKFVSSSHIRRMLAWENRVFDEIQKNLDTLLSEGSNATGYTYIFDFGGNFLAHLSSNELLSATKLLIDNFGEDEISKLMKYGVCINVTPAVELMLESLDVRKHAFFKRFRFFGTDEEMWKPALLERISKEELPPELGGNADFVPEAVYPIKFLKE